MDNIIKLETISQLHEGIGYEKTNHPIVSVIDLSKIRPDALPGNTKILQELYSVTLKEVKCGFLRYGRKKFDFQEGTLLCVSPDQVITIEHEPEENSHDNHKGWALYFHPDLIRRSSLGRKIHEYTFFSYDTEEALHLSDKEREILIYIFQKIDQEINTNIDSFTQDLIISNIELLLNYCKRFYSRQFIMRNRINHDIAVKFEYFIKEYINSGRLEAEGIPSVKYCGEEMALSPNYLSDLLKKETGKNTQEHIHYHVMEKAKTLLLSSDKSVSEIAYELGFEYPQYFSKLFKARAGITPGNYRK